MIDLMDVDTQQYVTLRDAISMTGRSKQTIERWVREGRVERRRFRPGLYGLNETQLMDVEWETRKRLAENRKVA